MHIMNYIMALHSSYFTDKNNGDIYVILKYQVFIIKKLPL